MPRRILPALVSALVLAAAGCGGGDEGGGAGAGGGAASVVPASALVYASLNADIESGQWKQLRELLRKFPDADKLEAQILDSLSDEGVDWERDVDPALGPELAIVFLGGNSDNIVALTQPDDPAKLDALLQKGDEPSVKEEIEGWTAIAETQQLLDSFKQARESGTLADEDVFSNAVDGLPDESLATLYVAGEGLRQFVEEASQGAATGAQLGTFDAFALAVTSEDDGVRLEGTVTGVEGEGGDTYTPELLDRVPAGALAVLSFSGQGGQLERLRQNPQLAQQIGQLERALGITLEQIEALFAGEGVAYVRSSAPFPEVTVVLAPDDPAEAAGTLSTLLERAQGFLGENVTVRKDGELTEADFGEVSVFFGVSDDKLIVSSQRTAFRGTPDETLADDEDFGRSKDAAGLGDETSGFLYLDLDALIPLIEGFAGVAGETVPPELIANLEPLDSFIVYAERDGDDLTVAGFLGVH